MKINFAAHVRGHFLSFIVSCLPGPFKKIRGKREAPFWGGYPIWNDFLTFSTGFSTDFVKKKWVFPRCFPLFPPSFPQKIELWVIHDVFQNGKRGKNWGEKGSQSLFLKRKSRPKIYFLRRFALGAKASLPSGIFDA